MLDIYLKELQDKTKGCELLKEALDKAEYTKEDMDRVWLFLSMNPSYLNRKV